jgi:hypothetical protein
VLREYKSMEQVSVRNFFCKKRFLINDNSNTRWTFTRTFRLGDHTFIGAVVIYFIENMKMYKITKVMRIMFINIAVLNA